jgi:hypothetical protein
MAATVRVNLPGTSFMVRASFSTGAFITAISVLIA